MVLSHQGKKEFASPVEPMTPEALALHFIDDLDSKINQLRAAREAATGMQFHRGLGRYVYLPALPSSEEGAGMGRRIRWSRWRTRTTGRRCWSGWRRCLWRWGGGRGVGRWGGEGLRGRFRWGCLGGSSWGTIYQP